jgi:hypothetical protein
MKNPKLTHRLLACLPPALLLAAAANHFYLVSSHELSPWLGAGFGMFATTDVGSARLLVVNAITEGGERYPVTLNEPLSELAKRVRGLPDRTQSGALADAVLDDLGFGRSGVAAGDLSTLSVEVWRTRYEPGTLRPQQTLISKQRFIIND